MWSWSFEIAEIPFSIASENLPHGFGGTYEDFLSGATGEEVSLRLHAGRIPEFKAADSDRSFQLGAWNLRFSEGKWLLTLTSGDSEGGALAVFQEDFSSGDIYYRSSIPEAKSLCQVLSHPIHQILMVSILSRGRGGMFHGAGIDDRGDGYLFLGRSADGKSTLASLWRGGRILDDDRIIIKERNGEFWMYGTPWRSMPQASPLGLPIRSVFFLKKGQVNLASPMRRADALSMALQRCFLPFWVKEGTQYVLDLCGRLAEALPCYELTFRRDECIVDYVRGISSSSSQL